MKAWEAMKLLEEGKKLRDKNWKEGRYIYLDTDGDIIDESNNQYLVANISDISKEWEMCDDRKEVPQFYKNMYKAIDKIIEDYEISEKEISDVIYPYLVNLCRVLDELNKEYKLDK